MDGTEDVQFLLWKFKIKNINNSPDEHAIMVDVYDQLIAKSGNIYLATVTVKMSCS